MGRRPQSRELGEYCCTRIGRLQGRRTHGAMRLEDIDGDTQGLRHQLLVGWNGGGSVEVNIRNHQSPAIVFRPYL